MELKTYIVDVHFNDFGTDPTSYPRCLSWFANSYEEAMEQVMNFFPAKVRDTIEYIRVGLLSEPKKAGRAFCFRSKHFNLVSGKVVHIEDTTSDEDAKNVETLLEEFGIK